jgi:LacI family transcriptional regulator
MSKQTPTLAQVAKLAGVSQMTASRALNDKPGVSQETREAVLKIAADIGYVVNRSAQKLSGGRNGIIGIMTPVLDNHYVGELVVGVGRAARAQGYETLVYTLFDEDRHSHRSVLGLIKQFTDGVVAILPRESAYFNALAAANVPVVAIDQRGSLDGFPSISVDSYGGAMRAVEHLAQLGHARIGFVAGDESIEGVRDRRRGYIDALARFGLASDPSLIAQGDLSQMRAFEAASALLALPEPPTAIFAVNDLSAFGVIAAAREQGLKVPRDLSVVGFDDIPMASQVHPPLTTIRQPFAQMGRAAVNTLLSQMERERERESDDAIAPRIVLPTELIVRQSTGPAPRQATSRSHAMRRRASV